MKRILLILSIILFTAICSQGQPRTGALPDDGIVHFYPNPATTAITFDLQKDMNKGYTLQVYNFLTKPMLERPINLTQRVTLDLTSSLFARGVYIYQIRDRNGNIVETGKFQISK